MTITVASKLQPKSILGIDIDKDLIAEIMKKDLMEVGEAETKDIAKVIQKKGRRRRKKKTNATSTTQSQSLSSWQLYTMFVESQSPASTSTTTRSTPGHPATSTASNKANTAHSTSTHKPHLMKTKNDFPNNVYFRQTNYVLKDETQMSNDTQQYDLILCLSITKWIHLNFGDAGLKSAFKGMFNQLRLVVN